MNPPEQQRNEERQRRTALLLLPLALLVSLCCVWTLFAGVGRGEAQAFIPAPVHSSARANYAQDALLGGMQSLSISIIESVIRDRDPEAGDASARATEVFQSMQTAVPTVADAPTASPTVVPTGTSTRTAVPSQTDSPTAEPGVTTTPSISPTPSPTKTPTQTWTPGGPSATPSKTPSKTPTPTGCKVPPYIEILAPTDGQIFDLTMALPAQAFAFDPDNANPDTCSITPPGADGQGISGSPEVEMYIEWWSGSSWVLVHTELENSDPYCAFSGCTTYDLSSGFWEDPDGGGPLPAPPINTGLHRMKVKARDDEGVWSAWHIHEFSIVAPTPTPSPTASKTPTPSLTPIPSNTPAPSPTSGACGPDTVMLTATGDAWIDDTDGDTNFGSDTVLHVKPTGGSDFQTLIQFGASGIPPACTVVSATLHLYQTKASSQTIEVFRIVTSWSEGSVTWDNQPNSSASVFGSFDGNVGVPTTRSIDITGLVQGWVNLSYDNYGLLLKSTSGSGDVQFSSREGSTAPQLEIQYAP